MRQFLCKAKTTCCRESRTVIGYPFMMIYDGYEFICIATEPILSLDNNRQDMEWSFVDEESICRYIGKDDIDGNHIFEKDIVEYWVYSERTSGSFGVILYDSENCCYRVKDLTTGKYTDGLFGMYSMVVQDTAL